MEKFSEVANESYIIKYNATGSITVNFEFNNCECNSPSILKDYVMSVLEQHLNKSGQIYELSLDNESLKIDISKSKK